MGNGSTRKRKGKKEARRARQRDVCPPLFHTLQVGLLTSQSYIMLLFHEDWGGQGKIKDFLGCPWYEINTRVGTRTPGTILGPGSSSRKTG